MAKRKNEVVAPDSGRGRPVMFEDTLKGEYGTLGDQRFDRIKHQWEQRSDGSWVQK